jgi:hypothetical protein
LAAQRQYGRLWRRHSGRQKEYAEEISILPAVQPNDEALAYR